MKNTFKSFKPKTFLIDIYVVLISKKLKTTVAALFVLLSLFVTNHIKGSVRNVLSKMEKLLRISKSTDLSIMYKFSRLILEIG